MSLPSQDSAIQVNRGPTKKTLAQPNGRVPALERVLVDVFVGSTLSMKSWRRDGFLVATGTHVAPAIDFAKALASASSS